MIGLDTNVLVRFLTQDDPIQSPKASALIERQLSDRVPGFISTVAMVETVWVLDRVYGKSPAQIAEAVERILQIDVLIVENEQEVFNAMVALKNGTGSFADALIGALGMSAGCGKTVTFDRRALRIPGFVQL
jgi:predicted nucleic-acid-binding protein